MTPPSERPATLARELGAKAVAIEHALEDAVGVGLDSRLQAAEESIARRFGERAVRALRLTLRLLIGAAAVAFFATALLMLALRYWLLPDVDAMRPRIEAIATDALKAPVSIGRIEASWRRLNPVLALNDVRIAGSGGSAVLALPRIEGSLSWSSLPALEPRFSRLRIHAPELEIVLLEGGAVSVAGIVIDPKDSGGDSRVLDWLLEQNQLLIRDARLTVRDQRSTPVREVAFSDADLLIESGFGSTRFGVRLAPPSSVAAPIDLRGDFRTPPFGRKSDLHRWRGKLFGQVDFVDLAWLNQWLHAPIDVQHANGALRAWLHFDAAEVVGVTADLALKDVDAQLARDLQPLKLSSFQGRITHASWGSESAGGQQVGLAGVTFVLASGAQFPALDLNYRSTRASGGRPPQFEIDGSRIDLMSLANIATHVPLGKSLRDAISRYAPAGQVSDFSVRWEGAEPEWHTMTAKGRFDRLSIAAQPNAGGASRVGTPGFERLTGSVQLERGSGALKLASRGAVLVFPGVFQEPRLAFDQLQADIKWKSGEQLEARIDSLQLANTHLDISASGTWKASSGSEFADLTGRIARLDARQAYRYVPLAAGDRALSWLKHALLDGQAENGSFRLRGDLAKFPFPGPADGEFRVAVQLRDAVLDVAPQVNADGQRAPTPTWPLIRAIDADLLFERQGMTIRAQRGTLNGVRITDATARIPDLDHNATLNLSGQAAGALGDLLGYVNASPVAGWIGNITRGAEARGDARLDLKLDLPLLHAADTRVSGTLQLQNNDLTLADVPPFSRANGSFIFNERGIQFSNLTAGFLGGLARFDATTRADGVIVVNATGTATPQGLKRALDIGVLQRLLDRAQGSARYSASLTTQPGGLMLVAESDLIGLGIDGIAPIRKTAGESMPVRVERSSRSGDERLRVDAGRFLGINLEHRRENDVSRLTRGVIAINEPSNLPESGMRLLVNMPRLDIEAWSSWLGLDLEGNSARSAAGDGDFRIDYMALRTPDLVIAWRSFRNVTLGATRTNTGGYDANVDSDSVAGFIGWRPGPAGSTGGAGLGQITARLSKLLIPASQKENVIGALEAPVRPYPAFDVAIEKFELGSTKYGRLEFTATNSGAGAAAAWRLGRLEVSNPDMKVSASGDWLPAPSGTRRMRIAFTLDTSDAGATLARFGMPGAVARGHGKLEGKLDWAGSPLDLDYATLNGNLGLRVDDGRFLKVDSKGAGRLLTLLSLQSLSRTLLTDTREDFGEGFAFSTIKADATVSRGVMSTENFSMTGAGAAAFISGHVDLRNETQQLHLIVLPEIDASTAALALGVANPILGLGALLANTVLKAPLSRVFAMEYDITGTWNDPVIARRNRITADQTESVR
jgi:uncharacterized protein (TIGR02099 family)